MPKCFILIFLSLVVLAQGAQAQQLKLGANPAQLEKSALLELSSTNQGLLLPRINDTAAINLLLPKDGTLIFFVPNKSLYIRQNGAWIKLIVTAESTTPKGPAGGDLSGNYPNPIIANDAVTNGKLADGAVTNNKLADEAVSTAKMANASVTNGKLAESAVTTGKVADGAITAGKLANTTVAAGAYGSGTQVASITVDAQGRLTSAANTNIAFPVTSVNGQTGAVTIASAAPSGAAGGDLSGNYPNPLVANDAITSGKILDATIVSADLADNAVGTSKLGNSAVTYGKIQNVSSARILGNPTAAAASPSEIAVGAGLNLSAAGVLTATNTNAGTVTSVGIASTDLTVTGGPVTSSGSITVNLPNVGTAGTYGSATQIPVFTTDAKGRITGVTNTATNALTNSLASGNLFVGNGSNVATAVALSGDATLSNTGALTLAASGVTAGSYGSASAVPVITVDAKGRVTGVTTSSFTGMSNALNSTQIWVGNSGNTAQARAMSGDGTLSNTGALTISDNAITTSKIINNAVTVGKIAANAVGTSEVIDASIASADLADNAVITSKLASNSVTAGKIAADAVGQSEIAAAGVGSTELADNAVTTSKINNNAVTAGKIAANAVGSSEITDGSVGSADLSDNAVTTSKINNNAVTAGKIAADAVGQSEIAASGVNTTELADNAVTTAKLANNAVTSAKIATGAVGTTELGDNAVSFAKFQTINANRFLGRPSGVGDGNVQEMVFGAGFSFTGSTVNVSGAAPTGTAGGDLTGSYPNPTVANNAITDAKLATNAVTTAKLADLSVTNDKIAAATITGAKIAGGTITGANVLNGSMTLINLENSPASTLLGRNSGSLGSPQHISLGTGLSMSGAGILSVTGSAPTGAASGDLTGNYPNPTVANSAITNAKLADGSITNVKISDVTITGAKLVNGTITATQLADGSVTLAKLQNRNANTLVGRSNSGTGSPQEISLGTGLAMSAGGVLSVSGVSATGAAGGDLTGNYPNPTVATDAITSNKILNGTVGADDLSSNAVVEVKIADGAVTRNKMPNSAVNSDKIEDGSVANADLAANAVTETRIADGAVTRNKVPNLAINTDKLENEAVSNAKLAPNAVSSDKILDNSITSNDIAANGINYSRIQAVTGSRMLGRASSGNGDIQEITLGTGLSFSGTTLNATGLSTTLNSGQILVGNASNVATAATLSGDATLSNTGVLTIAANAVGSSKIADGTVALADMANRNASTLIGRQSGSAGVPQEITLGSGLSMSNTGVLSATSGSGSPTGAAGGDLTGNYPNPTLTNSGATAGTYGTASNVPIVTVDAKGRVTNVYNLPIQAAPFGAAGGDLSGSYPNPQIGADRVQGYQVLDGTLQTADLADGILTTAKYQDFSITQAKLQNDIVGTNQIANGGVQTLDIADGNVTYAKIQNVTARRLLGRFAGSNGIAQEISLGAGLDLSTAGVLTATNTNAGTVTSVGIASTDLTVTGGPVTSSGSITVNLPNVGTAGTYGSATQIPVLTTDAKGRITGVTNTTINALTNSLASGNLFVGNGSNVATGVAMSGDATLSNTGAITIANDAVTYAKMQNVTGSRLLGNAATATGNANEISVGTGLSLSTAGVLSSTSLPTTLNSGNLFVGNGSNVATGVAMSGDATLSNTGAITIANDAVTYAKMQNVTGSRLLGNAATATGNANEISVGTGLSLSTAGVLSSTSLPTTLNSGNLFVGNGSNVATGVAMSGDATLSNTGALTIANDAVTYAKMQNVTGSRLLGNAATATGNANEISVGTGLSLSTAGVLSSTSLPTTLNSGNLFVGNGSNVATGVAMSGDATLSNTGAITIANNAVTVGKMANGVASGMLFSDPSGRPVWVTQAYAYGFTIQNGTTQQAAANFNIDGTGTMGSLDVNGAFTLGTNGSALTNIIKGQYTTTSTATVPANGERRLVFTVNNVTTASNPVVMASPSADLPAGVFITWARATANNTITICLFNRNDSPTTLAVTSAFNVSVIQ